MNTKGESPKPLKSRYGRVAEGNCVAARIRGEQPEAKLQAQMTNELDTAYCDGESSSIRRSLLQNNDPTLRKDSKVEVGNTAGGWSGHAAKDSYESNETCREQARKVTPRTGVRAAIVAKKPVMTVERRAVGR